MDWRKELGRRSGDGGWKDDFPLSHDLPDAVVVDCRKLELPIHPMFAVRRGFSWIGTGFKAEKSTWSRRSMRLRTVFSMRCASATMATAEKRMPSFQ
jgi:hypothetical protein